MSSILMAAHPTAGHTNALRVLGGRLRELGHDVAMALAAPPLPFSDLWPEPLRVATTLPHAIQRDGLRLIRLQPSPAMLWYGARIPRARGVDELALALRLFTAGMKSQARHLAREIEAAHIDVVLGDYLMPAALLAARLTKRPYAALYHSALPFPVEGASPFGSGLPDDAPRDATWARAEAATQSLGRWFDERVARDASTLGVQLRGGGLLSAPISDDLNLLMTIPELEPGLKPLTGPVEMVGPCLPRAREADQDDPALRALQPGRRHVYVSLGTVFNGQPRVFNAILDGLARHDVHTVVSAGASFGRLEPRAGPRTLVFRQVPQVPLLQRVDFVVTHGGNNTVQEALAAGRPMVVIPFGGDQLANARRVERLGVGVAVLPSALDATSVASALSRLLEPAVTARARALAASLEGVDGTERAVRAVLRLVK
ncbi:glycosyltransferase [Myxococcus sp. CA039A]|uniref:glycosyltransferase n=1 Tax=Myxococcus sp. CA039A TaxID=2741737 RepID=UPI00157B7E20|nr:glycosyltransferase [Myxococcus sp. CA039A]NTX51650.1 glycosyltransferase family 1 protein [Myxococcus sp. CA039A]